jgi:hypothetical protein
MTAHRSMNTMIIVMTVAMATTATMAKAGTMRIPAPKGPQ